MSNYDIYNKLLTKSVIHIFKNFLHDPEINEVFKSQTSENDNKVSIELNGTLKGELILYLNNNTLTELTKHFLPNVKSYKKHYPDIAGELANLISGTFINQLQFLNHDVKPSPPEFNEEQIPLKTLYNNINLSFKSRFGGIDIDFYYKEE